MGSGVVIVIGGVVIVIGRYTISKRPSRVKELVRSLASAKIDILQLALLNRCFILIAEHQGRQERAKEELYNPFHHNGVIKQLGHRNGN
jgi:ABC-type xylose transport system permease subunit